MSMSAFELIIRVVIAYIFLLLLTRLMGKKRNQPDDVF